MVIKVNYSILKGVLELRNKSALFYEDFYWKLDKKKGLVMQNSTYRTITISATSAPANPIPFSPKPIIRKRKRISVPWEKQSWIKH